MCLKCSVYKIRWMRQRAGTGRKGEGQDGRGRVKRSGRAGRKSERKVKIEEAKGECKGQRNTAHSQDLALLPMSTKKTFFWIFCVPSPLKSADVFSSGAACFVCYIPGFIWRPRFLSSDATDFKLYWVTSFIRTITNLASFPKPPRIS